MMWLLRVSVLACVACSSTGTSFGAPGPQPPVQQEPSGLAVVEALGRLKGWVKANPTAAQAAASQLFAPITLLLDTNRDGKMKVEELKAAHGELAAYWATAVRGRLVGLAQWLAKTDPNQDGKMNFAELLELFAKQPDTPEWDAFAGLLLMKAVDADRDGRLSDQELVAVVDSQLFTLLLSPALNIQLADSPASVPLSPLIQPAPQPAPQPIQAVPFGYAPPAPVPAPVPAPAPAPAPVAPFAAPPQSFKFFPPAPPAPAAPAPAPVAPTFAAPSQPKFAGNFAPAPAPAPFVESFQSGSFAPAPSAFAAPGGQRKLINVARLVPVRDPVVAPARPFAFGYDAVPDLPQPVPVVKEMERLRALVRSNRSLVESMIRGVGPELLELLDLDRDGVPTTKDLRELHGLLEGYWASALSRQTQRRLVGLEEFLGMDFTRNGEIVVPELLAVAVDNPEHGLWDALLSALYRAVDADQDGRLSQQEFDQTHPNIKQLLHQ